MVKLRNFSPEDLDRIIEIGKKSFAEPWPDDYFKKLSQEHHNDFIVAETSGKVVGYVLGRLKPDGSGSIKTIAIDPDYRQQGIGKELISFVISKLKEKGAKEVFLKLRTNNNVADKFYRNLGFEMVKTIEKYFPNGDDANLMKKEINNSIGRLAQRQSVSFTPRRS